MNVLFDCLWWVLWIGYGLLVVGLVLFVVGVIVVYFFDCYLNMLVLVFFYVLVIFGLILLKIGYVMCLSVLFCMC